MTNKHELGICECQQNCGGAKGQQEVAPELKRRFAEWIDSRTAKGIETYGGPLTTNNGRDVQRDMVEELLDFAQYQQQRIMELETMLQGLHDALQGHRLPYAAIDPVLAMRLDVGSSHGRRPAP